MQGTEFPQSPIQLAVQFGRQRKRILNNADATTRASSGKVEEEQSDRTHHCTNVILVQLPFSTSDRKTRGNDQNFNEDTICCTSSVRQRILLEE
eukprot:753571-Hanusia_phi.AAC.10